jgi:hypothetical protein
MAIVGGGRSTSGGMSSGNGDRGLEVSGDRTCEREKEKRAYRHQACR